MNIIGISALYHDSACCLLKDGNLVAAVQEERFTKVKSDPSMPVNAFDYCLKKGKLSVRDIDIVAYYENPREKLARQLWSGHNYLNAALRQKIDPERPEKEIRELLGFEGPIRWYDHHLSHAASSYFFSGFNDAAIFTVDGVGEWATTTYGLAEGTDIRLFEEVHFPDSLGLLYATITSYLGFKVNDGEYKVMGLAPYGQPVYAGKLRKLIRSAGNGQFRLDMKYFDFIKGNRMYSPEMSGLLGIMPRKPETEILQCHMDMGRSIQTVVEEMLIEKANYLYDKTQSRNLCMAGGVALNCVANGKILRSSPFRHIFVQPAANDAGCALGAAALAHIASGGKRTDIHRMDHAYHGPEYTNREIWNLLQATSLKFRSYEGDTGALIGETASRLAAGQVVGWFQGRLEFGPRSLGARSILADPRDSGMRDKINAMVKKRESFRPFAPSVLEDKAAAHFDIDHPSPFMLETCRVISGIDLPAITHVDQSARIQTVNDTTNPLYASLIREFYRITGCPIILNTSFNVRGQPIVNTPSDAVICFLRSGIDYLVIGDFIISKSDNATETLEFALKNYTDFHKSDIPHDVYTFL